MSKPIERVEIITGHEHRRLGLVLVLDPLAPRRSLRIATNHSPPLTLSCPTYRTVRRRSGF